MLIRKIYHRRIYFPQLFFGTVTVIFHIFLSNYHLKCQIKTENLNKLILKGFSENLLQQLTLETTKNIVIEK